ncbi:minor capsid protein [Eggerthellaceae bacterium zg-893]|nr:minor capsid protein [Eggerthellaceae bacterium zg-893]
MPPIPLRLLASTAVVRTPAPGFGGTYSEPREIRHVCWQPAQPARQTAHQIGAPCKGTLFIDAALSEGAFEVPAGSLVSVDGDAECCVQECAALPSPADVHHWEVALA